MELVMFAPLTWEGTWYSRHHLIAGLARQARVVHVADAPPLRETVSRPVAGLRRGGLTPGPHGLLQYHHPGWLPELYRWPRAQRVIAAQRARALERTLRSAEFRSPVYYVWHPSYQAAVAPLADRPLVYHAYDKYDHYEDAAPDESQREAWLARNARLCVAASAKLADYLRDLGARDVIVLRHGVDSNLFRTGLPASDALARIPRPRLGLVARINEALDTEILSHLADQRPHWSIVLVGGVHYTDHRKQAGFDALAARPNVYHVGPQPRQEVPRWLAGFDVGLMCYDLATWGPYNQPIKMYEYLGCGLPVVSSNIAAAREVSAGLVRCCGEPHEWLQAIEHALQDRSPQILAKRLAFAQANSWDRRVSELASALAEVGQE